jgi:hypothetical protein
MIPRGGFVQPKDAFSAISTTEKIAASLFKWITGNRGLKRTVAIELKENIELVRLYVESGCDPMELVPLLKEAAFRNALAQGFNFNSLKRAKISAASTKGIPQLRAYHGWSTQKLFESVYEKIATLKHAVNLRNNRKPVRIGVRLTNVFKLMVVLAHHIGE